MKLNLRSIRFHDNNGCHYGGLSIVAALIKVVQHIIIIQ